MARRTYETAIRILAQTKGAKTELTALTKRMGELRKETAALGKQKSGDVQIDQYRRLQHEIAATETAVKSLKRAESAREALVGRRRDAAPALDRLGQRAGAVESAVASLARDAAIAGGALAVAAAVPLAAFGRFEKAMAEVSTLVDTTKVSTAELSSGVRALAREYGGGHVEQAKALYQTISAGFGDAAQASHVLTVANKLAVAGVTNVDTAVNGLTTVLNAFKLGAGGAEDAADALITTMRLGKTTIPELSDYMFQAAPSAAALGVGLDKLGASVVALTLQGVPTSVAMTRVRAAMDALVRPSKDITAAWHAMGIKSGTAAVQSLGFEGALRKLVAHAKGDQGTLLKLLGSTEAVGAALIIGGTGAQAFDDALREIRNSAGATDVAVNKMRASFDFQARVVRARAEDVAISIGSKLAPIAISALTKISAWVDANRDKIEQWATQGAAWIEQKLIPGVQKFATQIWPVVTGVAELVARVADGVGGFGNLAVILGALRLAPLALSVAQFGVEIFKTGKAAWELVSALRAISAAQAVGAAGSVVGAAQAGIMAAGTGVGALAGGGAAGLATLAGGVALAGAVGGAVGLGADWLVGKLTGRSLSDRAAGVRGDGSVRDAETVRLEEQAKKLAEQRRQREAARAGASVTNAPVINISVTGDASPSTVRKIADAAQRGVESGIPRRLALE